MSRRFIVSDHHLMHANCYRFLTRHGTRLRPWAESSVEGDEMLVEAHNAVVRTGDTTYFLGDVAIRKIGLDLLARMNGRKILLRGNHDIFPLKNYAAHFADIRGTHKLDRLILSHYPLHPDSLPHWCLANVHGHTHDAPVTRRTLIGRKVPDRRYFNACIESLGLAPVEADEIVARIEAARKRRQPLF